MAGAGQPPSARDTSWDYDDEDFDDYEPCRDDDEGFERDRCVLGTACLAADPYHNADECFDEEMAKAIFGEGEERTDG